MAKCERVREHERRNPAARSGRACRFTPIKDFPLDKVLSAFAEGTGDGGRDGVRLTNPPRYDVRRAMLDGVQVLAIQVYANPIDMRPNYVTARGLNGGSLKRVDDKDLLMSSTEVFECLNAQTPSDMDMSRRRRSGESG